jgi:uncharacterized protein DUF2867
VCCMDHSETAHRARPWRVHAIAHDFHLEDLWAFELGARKTADARDFLACFWSVFGTLADSGLARARLAIGRALRWDDHDLTLPIPGCTETTVCARLGEDDRRRNFAADDAPSPVSSPIVKTVYVFPDEALYEFSNDTIHGLLHVGLAGDRASLAVYVKHRGIASHLYMAAIWPARHLVLYPSLIGKIERAWQRGPPYPR